MSFADTDLLCMQSPSVQFLDCKTRPSQSLPPFLGAGAVHSLLRQCVHSVPQVDHLLQEVHLPSTATEKTQRQVKGTGAFEGRGELSSSIKQTNKLKKMPPWSTVSLSAVEAERALRTPAGLCELPCEPCDCFLRTRQGRLRGTHRTRTVTEAV